VTWNSKRHETVGTYCWGLGGGCLLDIPQPGRGGCLLDIPQPGRGGGVSDIPQAGGGGGGGGGLRKNIGFLKNNVEN
jgi:hypothetical protein